MYLNKVIEKTPFKRSIDDLDLFDLPMVGCSRTKGSRHTHYPLLPG